jgi:glycosyltransferase involved in cell wall biosynthesis
MHIALVYKEESFHVGGISVFSERFCSFLSQKGHRATVIKFTNNRKEHPSVFRIPYIYADPRIQPVILPHPFTLNIFKKHLKNINPDLVYTSIGLSIFDLFLPDLCHRMNIPLAGVYHLDINSSQDIYRKFSQLILLPFWSYFKQVDLLHIFSHKFRDYCIKLGVNRDKILVLPNGVDTGYYKPGQSQFTKVNNIKKGVLFLGRLTWQKNPTVLIESFLSLNPPLSTKLVIAGEGDLEASLREKYKDKRIIFTGVVTDQKQKLDIIRSCQIFVLPSKLDGISLSLLEAMSCGLIPVISDAGSNDEIVNEKIGTIIPINKLESLLPEKLKCYLDSPNLNRGLSYRVRKHIIKNFQQKEIFSRLLTSMENTVEKFQR